MFFNPFERGIGGGGGGGVLLGVDERGGDIVIRVPPKSRGTPPNAVKKLAGL